MNHVPTMDINWKKSKYFEVRLNLSVDGHMFNSKKVPGGVN